MKICILGTGYVGLVAGACFADSGNTVWCIDLDEAKINSLNMGIIPIFEPGLKEMVDRNMREKRLYFLSDTKAGIENAQVCFITVGTPATKDGSADLTQVFSAARQIGQYMNGPLVVANKSTVPVGTAEKVRKIIESELKKRGERELDIDVVSNPEFLKEGMAIEDFLRPDRVVIGTDNSKSASLLGQLYEPFVRNRSSILFMDVKSAEITKYAANAMLATRISFMNEIARLCDKVGGDIDNVRIGIGTDRRIGSQFLCAGAGYGGSCFPKDVRELIRTGQKYGIELEIAQAIERVNNRQKLYLVEMIKKRFGENLAGKLFGIWGLAFKPQTDDVREAPSLAIINALTEMGASLAVYDPEAMEQAKQVLGSARSNIKYQERMMDVLIGASALILVTEWKQFRQPDFIAMKQLMTKPIIFDGRNQYDLHKMRELGFEYYCIGRNCHVR